MVSGLVRTPDAAMTAAGAVKPLPGASSAQGSQGPERRVLLFHPLPTAGG